MLQRIHMKILRIFGSIALPLAIVLSLPPSLKEKLPDGPIGTWIKQNNALQLTEWMSGDFIRVKEAHNDDPSQNHLVTDVINSTLGSSDQLILNVAQDELLNSEKKE